MVAKPLTDLQIKEATKKLRRDKARRGKFELPEEAKKAVELLKKAITEQPVMSLPDYDLDFTMKTDASAYAIGGVLYQTDREGKERVIWYASRTLMDLERKMERIRKGDVGSN